MTLAEKILELRTLKGISQGELAEKLGVSRQSVSKWETGQSVPELEKIIRLADLFRITVDELVREDTRVQPPQPQPQIVYVEKRSQASLRATQIIGILTVTLGCMLTLLALITAPTLLLVSFAIILLSLPLLLARRHPWLFFGWVFLLLLLIILNPMWTGIARFMWPWECLLSVWYFLTGKGGSFSRLLSVLFSLTCTLLLPTLLFFTWRILRPYTKQEH